MKNYIFILIFVLSSLSILAQNKKEPLDFAAYDGWNYIENKSISNDGNWIFYESNPYKGDGKIVLYNIQAEKRTNFSRATQGKFSPNSDFITFKIYPDNDTLRKLKLKDTAKDKLPKDTLGIFVLGQQRIIKIENIKSFSVAEKESSWMAYLYNKDVPEDTTKKEDEKKEKTFDKSAPETYNFAIHQPVSNKQHHFKNITEFSISENGRLISFIKQQNDTLLKSTLYRFDTKKEHLDSLQPVMGLVKNISLDHKGTQLAYIETLDTTETKVYSLYHLNTKENQAARIIDTLTQSIPEDWTVSEHGKIYFSDNDSRLFFGIAHKPVPEPEDTLLDEEKIVLDLWSWTDKRLQPQQLEELKNDLNKSYLSVYHTKDKKIVQLENETVEHINVGDKGNGPYALGVNYTPYQKQTSWDYPEYFDLYIINVESGEKKLFKEKLKALFELSPKGEYIYWYDFTKQIWYAYSFKKKSEKNLTENLDVNFFDKEHDYPMNAYPYGISGWVKDDNYILINDRYDIWKIDPDMKESPVNLTHNFGRNHKIKFNIINLNPDENYFDPNEATLLAAFNHENKQSGYYKTTLKAKADPIKILMDDYRFSSSPQKAKNAGQLVWQKQSFKEYYDIWTSTLGFNDIKKVSNENPQQDKYHWGDVEVVKWITPDGTEEEGLLYKPENFDPNKKYPMIVYFYRLHSDDLHYHYVPKPSRSVINPTFYVSNDYFVFMPNIRYKEGYPGESAYNYVVSGTLALLTKRDYLDKDAIGIQGQSWGGYQAGFIITRTDLFSAASIGAPVSNMTSAYGGIRWGSGMSRMFQYEKSQSRIGGTLWEKPLQYIENSPVFYAPKINTPVLIRHNDADGAVP